MSASFELIQLKSVSNVEYARWKKIDFWNTGSFGPTEYPAVFSFKRFFELRFSFSTETELLVYV